MIKRPTLILLILLLLAVVVYFLINNRLAATSSASTPTAVTSSYLITPADGALQILRITNKQNQTFQMQRDSTGTWMITLPSAGSADQGLAAAAETQVGALRILTSLDNQFNLADAGLDSPAFTIELTFTNGAKHIIQVGFLTPISTGYYVRFDNGNLYAVSQPGIDALLGLISAPPFPATATLVPAIATTSSPGLETITPSATLVLSTPTP
jgi:hypothetical protein